MRALVPPFGVLKPLVGVVHLPPLPGSPDYGGAIGPVIDRAEADATAIARGGMDGLIIENFGDAPFYATRVPPETVAAMTRALLAVMEVTKIPVGVNVLRNDTRAALGICAASGAAFVRVNVHIGAAWTDQGLIEGVAHETLRLRRHLAPAVRIFADVSVKHASPVTPRPLVEEARDCLERGKADALIVTGSATGKRADLNAVAELKAALPAALVFVGSGVDGENVADALRIADGVIVGTSLKRDGIVANPVDADRVARFVKRAR